VSSVDYEDLMRRTVALARRASAAGETAVGALVVWQGDVIGEGEERVRRLLDPSAHAEVMAIRAACQHRGSLDLDSGILVTTVEPCVLCAYAIRRTRLGLVVYGVPAGEAGGATSAYRVLTDPAFGANPPPVVVAGVLADECRAALEYRQRRESTYDD
jgi:tRNA(adenine34) deaminase